MGVPQTPSVLPVKHTIMKTQKLAYDYQTKLEVQLTFEISRRSASTSNLPCVIIEEENQKKKKLVLNLNYLYFGKVQPIQNQKKFQGNVKDLPKKVVKEK